MSETFCPNCGALHEPGSGECHRPPLTGRILPGGLRVLERLSRTDLGVLYRAESVDSHLELQLVVLHDDGTGDLAILRERLSRAAAIAHPNVATVGAIGETPDGVCYAVFEVLGGTLLSEIVERRHELPLAEAADLILQAAAGLRAAHEAGVPHGALSPGTILVTHSPDDRPLVKLIRFDLLHQGAVRSDADEAASCYAAPERLAGHPPSVPADVFSLGVVLHYVLAGEPPSGGTGWPGAIPDAIRPVLARTLDLVPERRFQTVAALAHSLRQAVSAGEPQLWKRASARGPWVAGAGASVLILAALTLWVTRTERAAPGATLSPPATRESRVAVTPPKSAPPPLADDTAARPAPPPRPRATRAEPSSRVPARSAQRAPVAAGAPDQQTVEPARDGPVAAETSAVVPPPRDAPPPSVAARPRADSAPPPAAAVAPPRPPAAPPEARPPRPELPAPSIARPLDPDAEGRAAAGRALATYAQALESSDLKAVEWAYPTITERERAAWRKFFSVARDLVVTLNIERFARAGSEVRLDVRGTYQYWNRSLRRSERAPVRFLATIKRDGDSWRLVAIR